MIYLTSDWHFSHNKNFIYEPRGYSSIEEMNTDIVQKHNSIIHEDDDIYCLGDCCLGGSENIILEKNKNLIESLKGNIHIIPGNHCTNNKIQMYLDCKNVVEICGLAHRLRYRKKEFILSHYPTIVTNGDDPKPVFNLHGHTHSPDRFELFQYHCYNVGVDAHNGYPVCIDDIVEDIYNKIHKGECI